MRIIAGVHGGRRLRAPRGDATRPTADRVREALFNILGPPPEGARVLDLFAGAGTLGLEALSRGAGHADFVDRAPAALRCLRDNIAALDVGDASSVYRGDALQLLRRLPGPFDWVFVDPPYRSGLQDPVLAALAARPQLLAADAVVVVEHDRRIEPASPGEAMVRTDQRRYGDTVVSFFRSRR